MQMSNRLARSRLQIAVAVAALSFATAAQAVELEPSGRRLQDTRPVHVGRPDRQGRHQPDRALRRSRETRRPLHLHQQVQAESLRRSAHRIPTTAFITVIDGAGWKGTGPVVDPARAMRLPKGSFMIDHAMKVHWDGTKDESQRLPDHRLRTRRQHAGPQGDRLLCRARSECGHHQDAGPDRMEGQWRQSNGDALRAIRTSRGSTCRC